MRNTLRLVSALCLALLFCSAAHANCTVTYTFGNGATADGDHVMQDFNDIVGCAAPLAGPHFTGAVGIGTSSPSSNLEVSGDIRSDSSGSNSANVLLSLASGASVANIQFHRIGVQDWFVGSPASSADFGFSEGSIGTYRIYFKSGGNIGIGTTSPLQRLVTQGQGIFQSDSTAPDSGNPAEGTGMHVGFYSTGGYGYLYAANNGVAMKPLVLNTQQGGFTGNVGIGTTSPATTLHVVGTIRQTNCTTAGTLSANASGDIICTSDARLKNVIGDYLGGLEALAQITPKLFRYKPTKTNPIETFVHAGFLAQDVMSVIPQASALQRDGYYSLDATAILAATVNSVKQLKVLADRQAAEIARLRQVASDQQTQEIARLKAANANLAAALGAQADAMRRIEARIAVVERKSRLRTAQN